MSAPALDAADLVAEPHEQFRRWFAEARAAGEAEPEAMSLATAGPDGAPDVRFVLLKGVDRAGWVFFTNFDSDKGRQLEANPRAALAWRWKSLERQVRVAGDVRRIPDAASDEYFAGRPRGSQIGAWASAQSRVLADRASLERQVAEATARFAGREVPRPPWWGGYLVVARSVELWQGRPDRLHDRLRYERDGDGWVVRRLSP